MQVKQWIDRIQARGWVVVGFHDHVVTIRCAKTGCKSVITRHTDQLFTVPARCKKAHVGAVSLKSFLPYHALIRQMAARRRSLGLSQEDICLAAGMADGHINKLEAGHRTAQMPTLQLWADTLGLAIYLDVKPLPVATIRAIEQRPGPLRETKAQKVQMLDAG